MLYQTFYKKGYVVQSIQFECTGTLDIAVEKAKNWTSKRHLKHIHTVPFLVNMDEDPEDCNGKKDLEEIDVT